MSTNPFPLPAFKYSGIIREDDPLHTPLPIEIPDLTGAAPEVSASLREHFERARIVIAPCYVTVGRMKIPQWSPTIQSQVKGFDPAKDCEGNFTSHRFQPNNNCYNYACNIATNSFAQPGRQRGLSVLTGKNVDSGKVVDGAVADGLTLIMKGPAPMARLAKLKPAKPGHFVALLISDPDSKTGWTGDFHWVRCDNDACTSWSQKNGPDQAVNFDFSGMPIGDPAAANWEVNQGPKTLGGAGVLSSLNMYFRLGCSSSTGK